MTKERFEKLVQRWRWILYAALAIALAAGFDFQTPSARFGAVEARQDSVESQMHTMGRYLRAIAVAQCLDRPRRDWQLMGLPCDELLQGRSIP